MLTGPYWVGERIGRRPSSMHSHGDPGCWSRGTDIFSCCSLTLQGPFYPNPLRCSYMEIAFLLLSQLSGSISSLLHAWAIIADSNSPSQAFLELTQICTPFSPFFSYHASGTYLHVPFMKGYTSCIHF